MPFCAVLALLSLALALWQWLAARRFPLHQRIADSGFAPAISMLKPLKGCDDTTAESLQSWFNQNYSGQIANPLRRRRRQMIPSAKSSANSSPKIRSRDAQLVVCEKLAGANAKVAKLAQLEKLAKHDLILVSDADVRVPPDFLANIVAPLTRPSATLSPSDGETDGVRGEIGLVNCFYRLANPSTTAMHWEAVAINADFWSQVLQSQTLKPLDFALGAAMLVASQSARRNRRLPIAGRLSRRRLPAWPSHRQKRPSHRALPRRRGMLGRADELARRLETPAPLGAHHPRLPAAAVFFQHPVQRHALAAAVAGFVIIQMAADGRSKRAIDPFRLSKSRSRCLTA